MAVPALSDEIFLQLANARAVWLRAVSGLAIPSNFAAADAVKQMHDAFEEFMGAIYRHYDGPEVWVDFTAYPDKIRQITKRKLRHDHLVKQLNDERVRAKHYGHWPQYRDIRALAPRCAAFLEENCVEFLGLRFSEVRLSSFVEHEEVKDYLTQAEDSLAAGDNFQTLVYLQAAFQIFVEDAVADRLSSGHTTLLDRLDCASDHELQSIFPDQRAREFIGNLASGLTKTQQLVELMAVGINPLEREVFNRLTPIVHLTSARTIMKGVYGRGADALTVTDETTSWAMDFVLSAILRYQTIPRPFDMWGRYKVKVTRTSVVIDGEGADIGQLAAGAVIENVGYCDHFKLGDSWMWEDGGQRKFIPLSDAEVVEERRFSRLRRDRRRELIAQRQDGSGNTGH
jgi:hypothetical protein